MISLITNLCLILSVPLNAQKIHPENYFLGQKPPVNIPQRLPLEVRQGFFAAERIAVSPDGKNIYYSEIKGYYPINGENIKMYSFSHGKWRGPISLFDGFAPALSVTGDTMYLERKSHENESLTFISVKQKDKWGTPKQILNTLDTAHYFQATRSGNYYISSRSKDGAGLSDWCRISYSGTDTIAVSLGRPVNTGGENQDFFVAADESFMIVTNRPGLGISYRKNDGSWSNPRNLGRKIDFGLGSWGPWVTPDNKYLFYTTGTKPDYSDVGVYWVRIDNIIDSLKNTNSIPYIKSLLKKQDAVAGQVFNYKIPENIFFDDDSKTPLTFTATLINGASLPEWLTFDPAAKTLSGTPPEAGEVTIKITVTDSEKASAYCPLKMVIAANPAKE
jgi:hypothetical protein